MKAAVIGAGRIGCGLVGETLRAADHEVVFVVRSRALADHFNRVGGYRVRLLSGGDVREVTVDGVRAVCVADTERVVRELAGADLIATCLRAHSVPRVVPLVAAGLHQRDRPSNVLTLENSVNAGSLLHDMVASRLPRGWPLDRHGFAGALAARVVSRRMGDPETDEPLTFVADPPPGFLVDGPALREPVPEIPGVRAIDEFVSAARHKLYTFSAGHAVAAYLGYLKGYRYVHTAVQDAEIRRAVMTAIAEGRAGLRARYPRGTAFVDSSPAKVLKRFENAALDDPVIRVGRDPQRKLAATDRLVGAAMLAEEAGIDPKRLALTAAAALCFEDPSDPSSTSLQVELRRDGVHQVLKRIARLDARRGFGRSVATYWARLSAGRREENHLLSLDRLVWAWAATEAGLSGRRARVSE